MRVFVFVMACFVVACFLPLGVASEGASQRYDAGTTPVAAVTCPACTMGLFSVGHLSFPVQASVPLVVVVADDLGRDVPFVVCQDLNGDGFCGAMGEPLMRGCGGSLALVEFHVQAAVQVFVEIANVVCGPASRGSVWVTYA